MQVTETLNEGLKRGYTITVTADELAAKVDEKLAEAQPEVEMKGFRKGKVPMALLKKQFGQRLLGEAMQDAVDGAMEQHFKDSGDRPAMQPEVKMTNEDGKKAMMWSSRSTTRRCPRSNCPRWMGWRWKSWS